MANKPITNIPPEMAVTGKALADLRERCKTFNAGWVKRGHVLAIYECGHCRNMNETPRPTPKDVTEKGYWDSLMTCTHCGRMNFVFVYPSGITQVNT